MKFAFALTAAFVLASSTGCCEAASLRRRNLKEHDKMPPKKARIIVTKMLLNNATVTFYEPEEGIISVVHDSPPEAAEMDNVDLKIAKSGGVAPETPGDLYKLLTGDDVVPKSLAKAQMRMKKHNARSLPPPPPESEDETVEGTVVRRMMTMELKMTAAVASSAAARAANGRINASQMSRVFLTIVNVTAVELAMKECSTLRGLRIRERKPTAVPSTIASGDSTGIGSTR